MQEIRTSGSMSGGWETERCRMAQATAPILDSTIPAERLCGCIRQRRGIAKPFVRQLKRGSNRRRLHGSLAYPSRT